MNLKQFFGLEEKRSETNGLQYVSNFSDALNFAPFVLQGKAMNLSAVYRATELISDGVAVLPIKIQNTNTAKNEVTNHSLNLVFGNKYNGNILSKYTMMKLLIQSVILKGNGFAYIERASDGTVTGLRYLEAEDVMINYNKNTGKLFYSTTVLGVSSKRKIIEPIDMIHLVKNSYDGVTGISVLSYAARIIKTSQATESSAQSFFNNGMNLSGVLTVQGQLSQKQKDDIRSSWSQAYSNGGSGLAVLQGNMSYQPIQINSKDAQMIESRQFNVQDIARFFGISPVLLGDLSHTSYNTIEAVQNDFLLHTLQPYIEMVENEFNRKLLKPSENKLNIYLETNEILRTDKQAQANYYSTLINNGVLSRNEVRKELGLAPVEGGDDLIIPFTKIADNTLNNNTNNKEQKPTE